MSPPRTLHEVLLYICHQYLPAADRPSANLSEQRLSQPKAGQALVMDRKRSWSWGCSALSCVLCWCADRSSGLRQRCRKSWPARGAGSSGGDDTSTRVSMGAKDQPSTLILRDALFQCFTSTYTTASAQPQRASQHPGKHRGLHKLPMS